MPRIVSFSKTEPAVRARQKTVTRRYWTPSHAAHFTPGTLFHAWSALPYVDGAEFICTCEVVEQRPETLEALLADPGYAQAELALEGGQWPNLDAFLGEFADARGLNIKRPLVRLQFRYLD